MKKAGIIFTIIIFTICLVAGYQITYRMLPDGFSPTEGAAGNSQQQNLILIHLDDLQTSKSKIESIWVLFLYYSNTSPTMTFMPVYQPNNSNNRLPAIQDFAINPDGSVPPSFIKSLQTNLDIKVDGYVLVDDLAVNIFLQQFSGKISSPDPVQPGKPDEVLTIRTMCETLKTDQGRQAELPWSRVIPDHFRNNIKFSDLMTNWIRLTQAAQPPHCEIIPGP